MGASSTAGPVENSGSREVSYSGRLLLRMPKRLHADLAALAQADGSSLNQFIVGTLSRAVGDGEPERPTAGTARADRPGIPRALGISLVVNAVVVVLAAAVAIVLLVTGWR